MHRGPIPGLATPGVLATYGIAGCLGGNNALAAGGILFRRGGRIVLLRPPMPAPMQVDAARLDGGAIVLDGMRWAPGDAQCCPSAPVTLRYVARDGRLVPERPAPRPSRPQ